MLQCCILCFSKRDLRQVNFLLSSVDYTPVFYSSSALCVEMFRSFARPGLYDAASLVPCCNIEGSGLRLAGFIILPVDDIAVAEVDGVGS